MAETITVPVKVEFDYGGLQPIMDELNDLRTFVWLVAESAYLLRGDGSYYQYLGEDVSALLSEAFDV